MLLRNLVGWMIAITRRWAVGSAESVKTIRAKTGTALVLVFYLIGFSIPLFMFLIDIDSFKTMSDKMFNAILFVHGLIILLVPLIYVFKVFSSSVVHEYVMLHTPKSTQHAVLQSIYALLIIAGAWWMVFGMPLFVYSKFVGVISP